ncbi:PNGase F N-terminal domain-containing protein [Saccharicrinis fermentans]|uniref:Peptide-N-glycosidase F N-terminal domain-containing protein n=1 Tax=Saccharicrinis fermentans DSM 9555 = JCM 21142 TaxID=869213 RepID=W7XYR3_9BACT|nr:PNGase F N-terminal domain-containing protein [Saccharicrinis fermentans]GAF03775.1 hypothetical protein JCM21142_62457 [Saccharicrinis fermentans DSM 9555 = JCM 21142]
MRKIILLLWIVSFQLFVVAQGKTNNNVGRVVYEKFINGAVQSHEDRFILEFANDIAKCWIDNTNSDLLPEVPLKFNYLDYENEKLYQQAIFQGKDTCYKESDFVNLDEYKPEGKLVKILGYECQKYVGSSFSNRIEIWVAKEVGIKGTPFLGTPHKEGLVLKYIRNGNYGWEARDVKIKKSKKMINPEPMNLGVKVNAQDFDKRLRNALVKDVSLFSNQVINWGDKIENAHEEYLDTVYRFAGGTVLAKKVKLPKVPLGTPVFAELIEKSNGDAYDRTGSVFVIPVNKEKSFLDGLRNGVDYLPEYMSGEGKKYHGVVVNDEFEPLIELMRFFTPFGVNYFNEKRDVGIKWADSAVYKMDVSHLLPVLQDECWIGMYIGNYAKGGHCVNLNLKYYLDEKKNNAQKKYWIQPVFNTVNVMEMVGQKYGTMFRNDTLTVDFEVPKGVKNIQFQYITTGHGGWKQGDEFVPKENKVFLDGKSFFNFTPWRVDCGTYRRLNPASGNFKNGMSSSDYSRSGWCPGTVANPFFMHLNGLSPGKHRIQVYIPLGEPEGNMFSAWNISGVFVGEMEE